MKIGVIDPIWRSNPDNQHDEASYQKPQGQLHPERNEIHGDRSVHSGLQLYADDKIYRFAFEDKCFMDVSQVDFILKSPISEQQ